MRLDQTPIGRTGAALFVAACLIVSSPVEASGADGGETVTILDVPFLSQGERLCGGAAAAMVLRYWGERDVLAEDFASFVDANESGIRGDVLADAVRARAWIARSFRGDTRSARDHLARGRPLIALIEDAPGRYHYVVLLAWLDGSVMVHDSARGPFRLVSESTFSAAWAATGFWTLLVLPDPDAHPERGRHAVSDAGAVVASSPAGGCDALVTEGVRLVRAGDQRAAEAALSTALALCPASARAVRELAGLRFVQSRWREAAELAARAAKQDPEDVHAWRLLAASRFIDGDAEGALAAWDRIGEPRIDLVRVDGLGRTRYAVVEDLLNLAPRTELTVGGLQRARRRLAMLPAASATRVGYRPTPGGRADIEAAIVERPAFPDRWSVAAATVHALTDRELAVDVAAPASGGARLIGSWRWWEARPRVSLSLVAPVAFGRSGLWRLDGMWARQPYAVARADSDGIAREDRQRVALSYADWVATNTRVVLGMGFDRWNRSRDHVELFGSVEHRLAQDRVAARAHAAAYAGLGRAASFASGGVGLAWRSTSATSSPRQLLLTARAGLEAVSSQAPFDIWPGADVGHARDVLLRAHPLLEDGVVDDGVFGRTLAHGGLELEARAFDRGPARIGIAVFGDVARAVRAGTETAISGTQVDVGVGLRVRVAGRAQTLRIDVAHGLADGRRAISAGWQRPWP